MAGQIRKQSAPAATTWVDLYTVGASKDFTQSTGTICNRGATNAKVRIAVRPLGAVLANEHYLYYDEPIPPNRTLMFTIGMTLTATDVVAVYSDTGNVTFHLYGREKAT